MEGTDMERIFLLMTFTALLVMQGCSQKTPESQVSFDPAMPCTGHTLMVSFIPGTDSPLGDSGSVLMRALIYPADISGEVTLKEIQMKKNGNKWNAQLPISESDIGSILFHFADEKSIDSNNEKGWDVLIHTKEGQPVRGAYAAQSRSYMSTYYMERKRDIDRSLELLEMELELYPDHWHAIPSGWYYRARKTRGNNEELSKIDEEVKTLVKEHPDDVSLLTQAYSHFNRRKNTEESNKLLKKIKKIDPENTLTVSLKWSEIRKLKDTKAQISKSKKLLSETGTSRIKESLQRWIVGRMVAEKQWKSAVEFVNTIENPLPVTLNQIALNMAENNIMLIQSEKYAQKAIDLLDEQGDKEKPAYMPLSVWKERQQTTIGQTLHTLGYTQHKLGKLDLAEKTLMEAFDLTEAGNADITSLYMQCLMDNEKTENAITVALQALDINKPDEKISKLLRIAYKEKTGSTEEAEEIIKQADKKALEKRKQEISDNFIEDARPAPSFTLKTPEGESISLESLKGKIVIVDFWAAWCGPCISSFPFLQKFWEQHKDDPDVMVLAVNTWERTEGQERINNARKFFADNGYTLPLLLDMNDKVVADFGVEGIPTKFFVGPDGKICFKDVGFHGPSMVDDMNIELDMIRDRFK
jgi:thiol-disulfide isomerase/thioredoxin